VTALFDLKSDLRVDVDLAFREAVSEILDDLLKDVGMIETHLDPKKFDPEEQPTTSSVKDAAENMIEEALCAGCYGLTPGIETLVDAFDRLGLEIRRVSRLTKTSNSDGTETPKTPNWKPRVKRLRNR
jgi:hypothetical protein